jgi:hypothetical protein
MTRLLSQNGLVFSRATIQTTRLLRLMNRDKSELPLETVRGARYPRLVFRQGRWGGTTNSLAKNRPPTPKSIVSTPCPGITLAPRVFLVSGSQSLAIWAME